jgi:Fur family ferric uptake transcriptional regulator
MTWAEHAQRAVKQANYSRGGAREAVIDFLGEQECASTAHAIYDAIRGGGRRIALASVYRALDTLTELRLIQRLEMGHGEALYEPLRPSGEHHHHVVCERCERIVPFEDPRLERAIHQLSGRIDFDIAEHDVVLRGRCPDCR